MKTIDNVMKDLVNGYELTIDKNSRGLLKLKPHPFLISNCEEVMVSGNIQHFPHILEKLDGENAILKIIYNHENSNLVSSIQKEITEGPYCENCHYETIENLEVNSSDILSGLFDLEDMVIQSYKKNSNKTINKKLGTQ